jgi:hypothetical protein
MKKPYLVLAYAPSGDAIEFVLICRLAGIWTFVSAARRQSKRLKRKVMTVMDKLRHVTPLPVTVRPRRHRWHVRTVAAVMAAGLALVLAALVTRNPLMFWAGYGLATVPWVGGLLWCRRHQCRRPVHMDEP